jgi:hypothetical protein
MLQLRAETEKTEEDRSHMEPELGAQTPCMQSCARKVLDPADVVRDVVSTVENFCSLHDPLIP